MKEIEFLSRATQCKIFPDSRSFNTLHSFNRIYSWQVSVQPHPSPPLPPVQRKPSNELEPAL